MIELHLAVTEERQLADCEAVIESGLRTFVAVGTALLTIRDGRLYRAQFGTFEDYCRERWGWERRHAYRLMDAAQAVENVSLGTQIVPESERQARPLTQLPSDVQPIAWQRAVETAPDGKITAAHVQRTVDLMRWEADPSTGTPLTELEADMQADWNRSAFRPDCDKYAKSADDDDEVSETEPAKPAWYQSSESDDWWTPQWLFELLDAEIGFETDVCASDANHKCDRYFTREQDGLAQAWTGKCWMNPPYGRSGGVSIYTWIEKAYWAAMQGATVACFIPARTDTTWWWDFCINGEVRFLKGRVKFANSDSIAPFPSAVVIFWPFVPSSKAQTIWWPVNGLATED